MKTTPAYNLNVVVRETGIKPDTLRAWERRYGLPHPSRTLGGHRLYSERDISTIRWLIERQVAGLRIKQAVNLWKDMESSGQDPLLVMPIGFESSPSFTNMINGSPELTEFRAKWVTACLAYKEAAAVNITNYAFALYPLETVIFEILLAGLTEIGDAWYKGDASVQQEHFASALISRRLDALIAATPEPSRPGTILVGCPSGEDHAIPPLTLTLLLRQRGWHVIYLGTNVPQTRLDETINKIKPLLVVLVAQQINSAASLLENAENLNQQGVRVAYGGLIFIRNPGLTNRIPGYYLGDQLKEAVPSLEEIIITSPSIPIATPVIQSPLATLEYYRGIRPQLEYTVTQLLADRNVSIEYLPTAHYYLSQYIQSALRLGNFEYLKPELNWIGKLIKNYHIKNNILKDFITTYYEVAKERVDERGESIVDGLSRILNDINTDL